jgi:defect in organelle trafficking protein DotD
MIFYKRLVFISSLLLITSGCATKTDSPNVLSADSVIAQKVAVAVEALQDYRTLIQEESRSQRNEDFSTDMVDVDYIGKPMPMLNALADRYGFKLVEIGKKNDLQIINLRMENTAPVEILRNISKQIDYGADLILDKKTYTLQVVYK